MKRWRRELADLASEFGCSVALTRGDHFRIQHPSGWFVFAAATPSDERAIRNVRGDLRRRAGTR